MLPGVTDPSRVQIARGAARADNRARWDERGGPGEGRRWPKTLIGHYVPARFE